MPSADFCAAIRRPFDLLSRQSDTAQTSRGKTNSLPHPPPNLRSAHLVDMDFVVDRPLVRRSRLISGSCSSVHAFAPRFLQTPPRDDALALRYPFTSTWLGRGLSPPSCRSCPAHDPSARFARSGWHSDWARSTSPSSCHFGFRIFPHPLDSRSRHPGNQGIPLSSEDRHEDCVLNAPFRAIGLW